MDRVHLVNPGQSITLSDRTLTAFTPPVFDNPVTTGFYDDKSDALISADCFGALLADVPQKAEDLSEEELRAGSDVLGDGRLPVVVQGRRRHFRQGPRRRPPSCLPVTS